MTVANGICTFGKALVLDGALAPGGAALVHGAGIVAWRVLDGAPRAQGDLFAAMKDVLAEGRTRPEDLDTVVAGTGPGSFTGLRVALGLARGLALARPELRLVGVDSVRILAASAGSEVPPPAFVAIPWGRLRVLLAPAAGAAGAVLLAREALAGARLAPGATVIVPPPLAELGLPAGARRWIAGTPPVVGLASLFAAGTVDPARPIDPVYLVPPDAVLPARRVVLPPGYQIVALGPRDLRDLVRVERASFEQPWSEGSLAAELEPDPAHWTSGVRAPGGELVAAAIGRRELDLVEIYIVAVDPGERRQGLGRALVRSIVDRARQDAALRIDLEVRAANAAAIALYAGEGFVPVGRRRRYYRDGADAVLMSLTLRRP